MTTLPDMADRIVASFRACEGADEPQPGELHSARLMLDELIPTPRCDPALNERGLVQDAERLIRAWAILGWPLAYQRRVLLRALAVRQAGMTEAKGDSPEQATCELAQLLGAAAMTAADLVRERRAERPDA